MLSIQTPAALPCPAWCADHTEDGRGIVHESRACQFPLEAEQRDVALRLHRGDELLSWQPEVIPGVPVLIFEGLWLSPAEARDLAYMLIVKAAQAEEVAA